MLYSLYAHLIKRRRCKCVNMSVVISSLTKIDASGLEILFLAPLHLFLQPHAPCSRLFVATRSRWRLACVLDETDSEGELPPCTLRFTRRPSRYHGGSTRRSFSELFELLRGATWTVSNADAWRTFSLFDFSHFLHFKFRRQYSIKRNVSFRKFV